MIQPTPEMQRAVMLKDLADNEHLAELYAKDVLYYMLRPDVFSDDTIKNAARTAARWGRRTLRRRRWLGLDRPQVFGVTATACEAKIETFSDALVAIAIRQFLEWGEQSLCATREEHASTLCSRHHGYFAGEGWAARVMRYHLAQLKAMAEEAQTSVFRVTTNCEAEVEMLKGAIEMSNRYPDNIRQAELALRTIGQDLEDACINALLRKDD